MTDIRELPKNIEAEQVCLGAAILEPEHVVPVLIEKLKPEHFYERRHRVIFRTIRDLFDVGTPCDVVLLANRLEEIGDMEKAGGRMYLNELLDRTTTTASLEWYADIVRNKAMLRALVEAGGRISELGFDEVHEPAEVIDRAEELIFDISTHGTSSDYLLMGDYLMQHLAQLESIHRDGNQGGIVGLSTGFPELDQLTGGLRESDLSIMAARPGVGKTGLMLSIAVNAAIKHGAHVGIFSLEMSKEQLLERALCYTSRVDLMKLRGGYVEPEKWRDLTHAAGKVKAAKLIVDDCPGASVLEIRARARRMHSQHKLDLIVVDYLQLVESGIRSERREGDVSYISRSLKRLARELGVHVMAASQLNRNPEGRENKRPRLADLRESGAIEQDADIVLFIYREAYHRAQEAGMGDDGQPWHGDDTAAELIVSKQRNGPSGETVHAKFLKHCAGFYPIAKEANR